MDAGLQTRDGRNKSMASSTAVPGMHTREHKSVLAGIEARALVWMARRLPAWVTPDHLSMLALASMAAAGCSFAAFRVTKWAALGAVASLAGNWFGDSLDGTLARVRRRERPRFGYYVDHVVDLAGTTFLFVGLACSGEMSPTLAMALLAAYLLVMAETFLATHATATFRISMWGFGPTELRIVLAAGALKLADTGLVFIEPVGQVRLFDLGGIVAIAGLGIAFVVSSLRNTHALYTPSR
jgi:phosphatidylglycerophosphate synthase